MAALTTRTRLARFFTLPSSRRPRLRSSRPSRLVIAELEAREQPGSVLGTDDWSLADWFGLVFADFSAPSGTTSPSTPPSSDPGQGGTSSGGSGTSNTSSQSSSSATSTETYFWGVPIPADDFGPPAGSDPSAPPSSGTSPGQPGGGTGGTGGSTGGGSTGTGSTGGGSTGTGSTGGTAGDPWAGVSPDVDPYQAPSGDGAPAPDPDLPPWEAPAEPATPVVELPADVQSVYTSAGQPGDDVVFGDGDAPPPDMTAQDFAISADTPSTEPPPAPPGTPTGTDSTTPNQTSGSTPPTGGAPPSAGPAGTAATTGGASTAAAVGALRVKSGGYTRQYTHGGSNALGGMFVSVTVTGTVVMQAGPDGQQAPYERVHIDTTGTSRVGTETSQFSSSVDLDPTPIAVNGSFNFVGLTALGTPVPGYAGPAPAGAGGWDAESWSERLDSNWRGDFLAPNGVTYQFAQSYAGTGWWTATVTDTTAADGTRSWVNRRDWGGTYRTDFARSDKADNFAAPPEVGSPIETTLPAGFGGLITAGTTYLNRIFDAGTYGGYNRYEQVTGADGASLRHPVKAHSEQNETTGSRYYFKNDLKVGDRTSATNPAEDEYAWLIDYQDGGGYGYAQDLDCPNEGPSLQVGTQTTVTSRNNTISKDVYRVETITHRAKDGDSADSRLYWARTAREPIVEKTTERLTETFDNSSAATPTQRKVETEGQGRYTQVTDGSLDFRVTSRDKDGQALGTSVGHLERMSINTAGGKDKSSATYTFNTGNTVADVDTWEYTSYLNSTEGNTTFTGTDNSGTVKTKTAGGGKGKDGVTTRIVGTLDATGSQQTGTRVVQQDGDSTSWGTDWRQVQGPRAPKTTGDEKTNGSTDSHWKTDLTFTDGKAGGTITGESTDTLKTNRTDTAVGTQDWSAGATAAGTGPAPGLPEVPGGIANLPPIPMTPTALKVNDRQTLTNGEETLYASSVLLLTDGKATGTVTSETYKGGTTEYTLDHLATRPNQELNLHSVTRGKLVGSQDDRVTTTYTAGDEVNSRRLVVQQAENTRTSLDGGGRLTSPSGWTRQWSVHTDGLAHPLPVPLAGFQRGSGVQKGSDTTVEITFDWVNGRWREASRHFDVVAIQGGETTYFQSDRKGGDSPISQRVTIKVSTDEVMEWHGTPAEYTFKTDQNNGKTITRHAEWWYNRRPADGGEPNHKVDSSYTTSLSNHETGKTTAGQAKVEWIDYLSKLSAKTTEFKLTDTATSTTERTDTTVGEKEEKRTSDGPGTGTGYRKTLGYREIKEVSRQKPDGAWVAAPAQLSGSKDPVVNSLDWGRVVDESHTVLGALWDDLKTIQDDPVVKFVWDNGSDLVRIAIGALDLAIGTVAIGATGGAGVIPGVALYAVGLDQIVTGANNIISGERLPSVIEYGATEAALAA